MPYSRMKLAVGIFVLMLFATVFFSLFLLLQEKGTFEKRYSYHFSTQSASSFNVGMPLKISGFNIGVIDNIALNDDGTVYMTFSVGEANKKWLRKDSVLVLNKPLIGSPHIELYSAIGNDSLEQGESLKIMLSDDINDMISKLEPAVNKIINIIDSIDSITSYIARDDSELIQILKNIEQLTFNLANSKSLLTTITGDSKSTQSLINSLNETAKIMKDISTTTSSLDSKIINPSSSAIKELDAIMKDVKQKLEALDATVKAVGTYDQEILQMKEEVAAGLHKSNQIMDKVDALLQDEKNSEVTLP